MIVPTTDLASSLSPLPCVLSATISCIQEHRTGLPPPFSSSLQTHFHAPASLSPQLLIAPCPFLLPHPLGQLICSTQMQNCRLLLPAPLRHDSLEADHSHHSSASPTRWSSSTNPSRLQPRRSRSVTLLPRPRASLAPMTRPAYPTPTALAQHLVTTAA